MKVALVAALLGLTFLVQTPNTEARPRSIKSIKRSPLKKPTRWICSNTSGTRLTMTDCERDYSRDVFHGEFGGHRRPVSRHHGGLTWNQIQALKQSLRDQSASTRSRAGGHYY